MLFTPTFDKEPKFRQLLAMGSSHTAWADNKSQADRGHQLRSHFLSVVHYVFAPIDYSAPHPCQSSLSGIQPPFVPYPCRKITILFFAVQTRQSTVAPPRLPAYVRQEFPVQALAGRISPAHFDKRRPADVPRPKRIPSPASAFAAAGKTPHWLLF